MTTIRKFLTRTLTIVGLLACAILAVMLTTDILQSDICEDRVGGWMAKPEWSFSKGCTMELDGKRVSVN